PPSSISKITDGRVEWGPQCRTPMLGARAAERIWIPTADTKAMVGNHVRTREREKFQTDNGTRTSAAGLLSAVRVRNADFAITTRTGFESKRIPHAPAPTRYQPSDAKKFGPSSPAMGTTTKNVARLNRSAVDEMYSRVASSTPNAANATPAAAIEDM